MPTYTVSQNDAEFHLHELERTAHEFGQNFAVKMDALRAAPRRYGVLFTFIASLAWVVMMFLDHSVRLQRAMLEIVYHHEHTLEPRVVRHEERALDPAPPQFGTATPHYRH